MIKSVRLGNLTRIRTGKLDANAATENGIYPFFTCSKQPLSIDNYAYDCECVLVAGNGDLNVKYYSGRFEAYQRTYIIESLDASKLMVKYLYYFLEGYVETLRKQAIGGVIKYIKLGNLTEAVLPLPSIDVQREIVDRIEKCDDMLSIRHSQLDFHDQLVKSRFIEMFGTPQTNSMNWNITTIGDVISSCEAGWSGNGKQKEKRPGEIAVLKVSAVTKGYFIPEECKVLDDQNNIKKYIYPQKGDLLFSRANTREMVGATAIIQKDYPEHVLPDKLWRIRFKANSNVYYMKYILSSKAIRDRFSAESTGTSGSMYNISMEKFRSVQIPIPPLELQEQFAVFVQATDKSKYHSSLSLEHCLLLAKHIQKRKMTCQTLNF